MRTETENSPPKIPKGRSVHASSQRQVGPEADLLGMVSTTIDFVKAIQNVPIAKRASPRIPKVKNPPNLF